MFSAAEIVVIIAALSAAVVQIISAWKTGAKADVIKQNTATLLVKAEEIQVQTNGNLSALTTELKEARQEIAALKNSVTNLKVEHEKERHGK